MKMADPRLEDQGFFVWLVWVGLVWFGFETGLHEAQAGLELTM